MVSPNLANINSLYAFSKNARLSRTEQSILYNSYSTLFRINSILAINNNTTTWASVTLPYLNYGTNIKSNIINTVLPPLSNATVLLDKQNGFFLEESDELLGISNVNNSVDLVVTYDEFFDGPNQRINYLAVAGGGGAGGGGGGGGNYTAGGGGGGVIESFMYIPSAGSISIIVGAGGVAGIHGGNPASPAYRPGTGSNTSICFPYGGAVAYGGGGGAGYNWTGSPVCTGVYLPGLGGSGGGGVPCTGYPEGNSGPGGGGIFRQGYPGNPGVTTGGGGGGGGQAGQSCNGGNGFLSSITGTLTYYAGGGGGSGVNGSGGGRGGLGGGAPAVAAGGSGNGTAGNVNTGGGASGGASSGGNAPWYTGNTGGSGIVIISYPGPAKYTGGTVSCVGNKVVHCFTSSGSLCILS